MIQITHVPVQKEFLVFDQEYINYGIITTCQCGAILDLQGKLIHMIFKGHSDEATMWQLKYPFSCIKCGVCIGSFILYEHK